MKKVKYIDLILAVLVVTSCHQSENDYDASGSFEAVETIISAEANGKIMNLSIEEGQLVKACQVIGAIDSTQLHFQKLQLMQNKKAVLSGKPHTQIQIQVLKEQLATANTDRSRLEKLVKSGVANQKQLDDANARIATLQAQIDAQKSSLNTTSTSLDEQGSTIDVQLELVKDQLAKCKIVNPIQGTILSKYAEQYEMTSAGRPLYKIADLSEITLRAYVTASQFASIKLNQQVTVLTDNGDSPKKETSGVITWISDEAEFTPKSILTKEVRENLVYAIKVRVPNDGTFKIGMYGEVRF